MADFRRFIVTACFECVIDVVAWTRDDGDDDTSSVDVGLLSFHGRVDWRSLRGRVRRCVRALRGEPYPWLEFCGRQKLAAFIGALREAAGVAFPSDAVD